MNYDKLFKKSYSNVAFMGGWREDVQGLTGFLSVISDGKHFVALNEHYVDGKLDHYEVLRRHVPTYRYINDMIWKDIRDHKLEDSRSIGYWKQLVPSIYMKEAEIANIYWKPENQERIYFYNISANIHVGDEVEDLNSLYNRDKRFFKVTYLHDLKYINQNQFYKLKDRISHPNAMTRSQMLETVEGINPFEKYDFIKLDKRPKDMLHLLHMMKVNGKDYHLSTHDKLDRHYIFDGTDWYETRYGKAWDCWRLLKGNIFSSYDEFSDRVEHNLYEVEEQSYFMNKVYLVHNERFQHATSYRYNNLYIKITGNNPHF